MNPWLSNLNFCSVVKFCGVKLSFSNLGSIIWDGNTVTHTYRDCRLSAAIGTARSESLRSSNVSAESVDYKLTNEPFLKAASINLSI